MVTGLSIAPALVEEALAARQPSKQPDSVALGEATEFCIEKGDRQPVGAVPQGCDACDRTGIRQNDEGRNICCPDCDLGNACAGDTCQPVGQEPAFFANRWEMEHGTADGLVAMRAGKHMKNIKNKHFFTVPLYTAPPAQAVDLGQMPHGIRLVEIPRRNGLDPINVFVQDYELGRGRIVVTCYGQAWCGFWGAMGDRTVMQFVAACDADYVAGNMLSGRHEHVKKHERTYVERIAIEVIAEFRALIDGKAVGNG